MNGHELPSWPPSEPAPQGGAPRWGQVPAPPPAAPSRPGWKRLLTHGAAGLVGLLLGMGIGASGSGTAPEAEGPAPPVRSAASTVTAAASAAPAGRPSSAEAPRTEIAGDGTFLVGRDVRPGTYRTAGPQDDAFPNCYWARLRNTSGDLAAIIANDNAQGQAVVTIAAGDRAFDTKGCRPWTRIG
ncbi:hypothetical protein ACFWUZ_09780 [Streptomyces sp. NPDC058646]|uniref:hypothetical protein n=1 Tax=Streptomyces sp. NPDC058646 TaxID=3346574 RepID=UPI003667CEFE